MALRNTDSLSKAAGLAVALALALLAIVPHPLWTDTLAADMPHRADVIAAITWVRMVAVPAAVFAAAFSLIPQVRHWVLSRYGVFALPLGAISLFCWFKSVAGLENAVYLWLAREDGLVEDFTALFLFAAAVLFLLCARTLHRRGFGLAALAALGLAGFTLLMGLEEISYGQRIFGYETPPAIAAANTQQEFNLHNDRSLQWIAQDMLPGLIIKWGLLGWIIIMAAALLPPTAARMRETVRIAFPAWFVVPYFLPFALWAYHSFIPALAKVAIWQDQEPAEMVLGLAFLVHAAHCRRHVVRLAALGGAEGASVSVEQALKGR